MNVDLPQETGQRKALGGALNESKFTQELQSNSRYQDNESSNIELERLDMMPKITPLHGPATAAADKAGKGGSANIVENGEKSTVYFYQVGS